MSTLERPVLTTLSANFLNRKLPELHNLKPNIQKSKSYMPPPTLTSLLPPQKTSFTISKPSKKEAVKHAEKLKYRLKLAYYKVRTDQTKVPINEIMKKDDLTSASQTQMKKLMATPSLTRHISLLAASTPLQPQQHSKHQNKHHSSHRSKHKRGSLKRSKTSLEPLSIAHSISKLSSSALSRISEYSKTDDALRSFSFSKINRNSPYRHRSLRIEDLVNNNNNNNTGTEVHVAITPVKRKVDANGDLIMSSPTKKICSSTPGSYGAAKSLLQLSLISSN